MKQLVKEHFANIDFKYVAPRDGEVLCTKADIGPLKKLGWSPRHDIKEGVSECFRLLKEEVS